MVSDDLIERLRMVGSADARLAATEISLLQSRLDKIAVLVADLREADVSDLTPYEVALIEAFDSNE